MAVRKVLEGLDDPAKNIRDRLARDSQDLMPKNKGVVQLPQNVPGGTVNYTDTSRLALGGGLNNNGRGFQSPAQRSSAGGLQQALDAIQNAGVPTRDQPEYDAPSAADVLDLRSPEHELQRRRDIANNSLVGNRGGAARDRARGLDIQQDELGLNRSKLLQEQSQFAQEQSLKRSQSAANIGLESAKLGQAAYEGEANRSAELEKAGIGAYASLNRPFRPQAPKGFKFVLQNVPNPANPMAPTQKIFVANTDTGEIVPYEDFMKSKKGPGLQGAAGGSGGVDPANFTPEEMDEIARGYGAGELQ